MQVLKCVATATHSRQKVMVLQGQGAVQMSARNGKNNARKGIDLEHEMPII